jgi:transketolase
VDVATGSLGQGLPIGVGIALALSRLESSPARVWVLCGDELAEGLDLGRPSSTPRSTGSTG